jgi:hypothetical protein
MLSFEKGRPIAKIVGGDDNGELLHISDEADTNKCCDCKKCSNKCYIKPCCKKCCMAEDELEDESLGTDFELENGVMIPVPNIDTRDVLYVAGPAGSGKSTFAAKYAEMFQKLYPQKEIIVFSRKPSDPVLDKLRPSRFIIDESIVENPIDFTKELTESCLVIFDDCNTFPNDKVKKAVSKLMMDLMEVGRSFGIYMVITSHLLNPNERKDSRTIWNEATAVCIFPKSGNKYGMQYALKNYCGFDTKTIKEILEIPSRWVMIAKTCPQYILYETGCFIP